MNLNRFIDHTLLKANATETDILHLIEEAKAYSFFSVCVHPSWVAFASERLHAEPIAVCTVIGFPLGANATCVKHFETVNAIENGADEVDMVLNVGAIKSGHGDKAKHDIQAVVDAAKGKAIVKVILETALLTPMEIGQASRLVEEAGANFVKTSTGFSTHGATVEHIHLIKKNVGSQMGIKASGGIHTAEQVKSMLDAGATRIGTSAGVAIMSGLTGMGY